MSDITASKKTTASKGSRFLGVTSIAGVLILLLFAFIFTDPDIRIHPETGKEYGQFDAVRLLYLHVPLAVITYLAYVLCAIASAGYLFKKTRWWDAFAHSCAEVGTLTCGLVLLTGSIWGRPVWNTWWEWGDVRLMSTLILFLLFLGYLALRKSVVSPQKAARPAAVVALIAVLDIPLINRSVEWWENRTLHQKSTLSELKIEDLTLFTLVLGMIVIGIVVAWLILHRFRIAWLEWADFEHGVKMAIEERLEESKVRDPRDGEGKR